jgi:HEAT repeat protein
MKMNRSVLLLVVPAAVALGAVSPLRGGDVTRATPAALAPAASFREVPPPSQFPQDPADSLYRAARAALNANDYRLAAQRFREIRQRYPRSAYAGDALYWEAFALYRLGGSENLRAALQRLERQGREHPSAGTRGDAGALSTRVRGELARLGDSEAAAQVTRQASRAAQSCPSEDEDARTAALNALLQMNSEQALPILSQVLARRDECSAPLREKAVFIISQKRAAETEETLLRVARTDPSADVREKAVFWLSQVPTDRAVAVLEQILRSSTDDGVREKAIFALSQHRSARASQLLRAAAEEDGLPDELREKAIFWLGQGQSADQSAFLKSLYGRLSSPDLKEKVLFSLSQQEGAENRRWLLELAANEREPLEMRKKAVFWAGQSGAALTELSELYDRLTTREVREQVIFVLSQRSEAAAVDRLIQIARSERDPELRRKAIFWLGQSEDPRVAQVLLEIIQR